MTQAEATFEITGWDEKPYEEIGDGMKLTRAHVTKTLHGDIEGEGRLEYLLFYRADGTADFVGLERIEGRLGGREGSFALQHIGAFEGGVARATVTVVDGSGTGELEGLAGEGDFRAVHEGAFGMVLEYEVG
jgi:hypothetical protein